MTAMHTSRMIEAASAALFVDDTVLLIQRAFPPSALHWSLPGGRLEAGEVPIDCVRREIGEELGLSIAAPQQVTVRDLPGFRLTVFALRLTAPVTLAPNDEIAGWVWYSFDQALPQPHTEGLDAVLNAARQVIA